MFEIIVARDNNNGIGYDNNLLYHIPNDMKHFKETTKNSKVIMGRKTFKSLPTHGLKDRTNIVLTKRKLPLYPNVIYCNDLEFLINSYINSKEKVYIIGGSQIYKLFLPYTKYLNITQIDNNKQADTFFDFNKDEFILESSEKHEDDGLKYSFDYYKRKTSLI